MRADVTKKHFAAPPRSALPEMHSVESSVVRAIGYDGSDEGLYVEMVGGRVYVYRSVERSVFEEFMDADSKGRFLNLEIKPHYGCDRVM